MKKIFLTSLIVLVSFLGAFAGTEAKIDSLKQAKEDSIKVVRHKEVEAKTIKLEKELAKAEEEGAVTDLRKEVKEKFIEGGVPFMSVILVCLIIGLAIAIERIIVLNLASTNVKKLLANTRNSLKQGGVNAARALTASVPGPVASIFNQGLLRASSGPEAVEKSIVAYGSVEMGKLERGMSWVSLFISLAPMFGFMGTVIGMIGAFESIQQAEDIKIDQVAYGIKTALLTTVAGLIVAVILQILYNYCVSKIDAIVNQMEEASISLVDMLIEEDIAK